MMKNVGRRERMVRALAGTALAGIGLASRGPRRLFLLPAAALLCTAYFRYCPFNRLCGVGRVRRDETPVQQASEESFPASDAPAWTMGG